MASKHQAEKPTMDAEENNEDDSDIEDDENCVMCEDDSKVPADKYCRNCGILYCESCLSTRHPPRGPLKRHILISAERYQWEKARAAYVKEMPVAEREPICEIHYEPYYLYCNTCLEMLCKSCWFLHRTHRLLDIPTACRQQKAYLETKTRNCLEMRDKMGDIMNNLKTMIDGVQSTKVQSKAETEKTYNQALLALESWREDSMKVVHDKYGNMQLECEQAIQLLKLQMSAVEMAKMHLTAQAENEINAEREAEIALQKSVFSASASPAEVSTGREVQVSRPVLKFVHTTCPDMVISQNGAQFDGINGSSMQCDVLTDGQLQFGKHYWEMVLTVKGDTRNNCSSDVKIGLTQLTCRSAPQPCDAFWGVGLAYCIKLFKCECLDNYTELQALYEHWQSHSCTHRVGFYLDCVNRTLTLLDLEVAERIAVVNDICVSKALVPSVRISKGVTVSAHLIPADP